MKEEYTLEEIGKGKDTTSYRVVPCGIGAATAKDSMNDYAGDAASIISNEPFAEVQHNKLSVKGKEYDYVLWGNNDQFPYEVASRLNSSMITAQCQAFNILACYGQGVRFVDRKTKIDVDNADILDFCLHSSLHNVFLKQSTDMKYWYWSVNTIILSNDGKKIVRVGNRDVMFCRLEYAPSTKSKTIEHVFYGNFKDGKTITDEVEVLPLLDMKDPLGDLQVRMGLAPDPNTGKERVPTKDRMFAVVCRMGTPGCQYYPMPYFMSIFRDYWDDIYRLIGRGKRYMIKNTTAPRTQIEVHNEYWDAVCDNESIQDEKERVARKQLEKQNIIDFVTGLENAGKALVSGYYVDPNGKENRMVRINVLNEASKKEGGNWSDDMSEASNALCFAFGVHPNLVGATPGKSQMNNSGSDKRELFTLKQATEKPFHDVMAMPYHLILHYNGWQNLATVDVPMIMLTTLDENKDAKKVTNSNTDGNDGNNNK